MTFPKIYLGTLIQKTNKQTKNNKKKIEKLRISELLLGLRSADGIFKNIESSGYITFYISLESIFFSDFKQEHKKL